MTSSDTLPWFWSYTIKPDDEGLYPNMSSLKEFMSIQFHSVFRKSFFYRECRIIAKSHSSRNENKEEFMGFNGGNRLMYRITLKLVFLRQYIFIYLLP